MISCPTFIRQYLYNHFIECRFPGYLYVSQECIVLEAGGDLAHYGLHNWKKNECITEHVCFLHGLLPLGGEPVIIPFIQFDATHFADLHLLPGESGDWVLLLDATQEAIQRQRTQQLSYQHS